MKSRILLGSGMLLLLALLFFLDHTLQSRIAISAVAVVIGAAGWLEFARMAGVTGASQARWVYVSVGLVGTVYFLLLPFWPQHTDDLVPLGLAALIFAAFFPALVGGDHKEGLRLVLATVFGVLLWGFLFSFTLRIYHLPRGLALSLIHI